MRYATISEDELLGIKKLHESMLSKSSHGLFHSMGKIIGEHIIKELNKESFFEDATRVLKERNFVEDISFEERKVTATGCIEVTATESPSCDILRGIISALYREFYGKKLYCEETRCGSVDSETCIFELREEVI